MTCRIFFRLNINSSKMTYRKNIKCRFDELCDLTICTCALQRGDQNESDWWKQPLQHSARWYSDDRECTRHWRRRLRVRGEEPAGRGQGRSCGTALPWRHATRCVCSHPHSHYTVLIYYVSQGCKNLGLKKFLSFNFCCCLGFLVQRLNTKVRPKSTWKTQRENWKMKMKLMNLADRN